MIGNNWLANVLTAATRPMPNRLPWAPISSTNALAPQNGSPAPVLSTGGVGSGGPLQAPQAGGGGALAAPGLGTGTGGPFMTAPGSPASPVGAPAGVTPSAPAGVHPNTNALAGPQGYGGAGGMATPAIVAATGHPYVAPTVTGMGIPLGNPAFIKVSPFDLARAR